MTLIATNDPGAVFNEVEDGLNSVALLKDQFKTLSNQFGFFQHQISQRPINWSTQIYDLGEDGYSLNVPILITIEEYADEEVIIARFPEVELLGQGVTEADALSNLKLEILDLFDELSELDPEEMGDVPKSWLRVLKSIISGV